MLKRFLNSSSTTARVAKLTTFLTIPTLSIYYYSTSKNIPHPSLTSNDFTSFTLTKVTKLNHDTSIFQFACDKDSAEIPITSCVVTKFQPVASDASPIIKPYTPINIQNSTETDQNSINLLIKKYDNGPMSTHIHSLTPGDCLDIKGPISKYPYTPNQHSNIALIAGGTGITPMLQLLNAILSNPIDKTPVTLIYSNHTPNDILLKSELDRLSSQHKDQFKLIYTVSKPTEDWSGNVGRINTELLKTNLPLPETETAKIFVCGPGGMMETISGNKAKDYSQGEIGGILKDLGYVIQQVYKF